MKGTCKSEGYVVKYLGDEEMYRSGRNENDSKSFCP